MLLVFFNLMGIVPGVGMGSVVGCLIVSFGLWLSLKAINFSDFVPSGVPLGLIGLLYVVEIISLLVRPFAMTLRICVNLLCGHLLLAMSGLSNSVCIVLILEMVVCVVQGYVYVTIVLL